MDFTPLHAATLIKRYKRFLADVRLADGRKVTVHCPNTGAMTGCAEPGMPVWLSHHSDPKRKLEWTWELVDTGAGLTCIHSALANRVVQEAIEAGFSQVSQRLRRYRERSAMGRDLAQIFVFYPDTRD